MQSGVAKVLELNAQLSTVGGPHLEISSNLKKVLLESN